MALLFSEGFDGFMATADLEQRGYANDDVGQITIVPGGGPTGGNCLRIGDVGATTGTQGRAVDVKRPCNKATAGSNAIRMFFWISTQGEPTGQENNQGGEFLVQVQANEDAGPSWGCRLNSAGAISVNRTSPALGSTRTAIGSGKQAINDGLWHYIEIAMVISNTAGSVKIVVDGAVDIDLAGLDTTGISGGSENFSNGFVAMASGQLNPGPDDAVLLDDVVLWDDQDGGDDFIGELPNNIARIVTLRPDADTSFADFSVSAGTAHFQLVNEPVADDDTSYVESATMAHKDAYGFDDVPAGISVTSVLAVNLSARVRNTDVGMIAMNQLVRSGSSEADGEPHVLPSQDYAMVEDDWRLDPQTSSQWTKAGIGAAVFGFEVQ